MPMCVKMPVFVCKYKITKSKTTLDQSKGSVRLLVDVAGLGCLEPGSE